MNHQLDFIVLFPFVLVHQHYKTLFAFWVCLVQALEISIEDLSTFVFDNLLTRPRLSERSERVGKTLGEAWGLSTLDS